MKAVTKILTGAAGVAALVGMAAPAAAQYPGYYPGYNPGANVIGQVLQSVLNPYGQQQYHRISPQAAVSQCTAAVQSRLVQRYNAGYNPYGGYSQYGSGYGQYGGYGYANTQSQARVLGVRNIEHRSSTTMRVRGYATSGMQAAAYGGYGYNPYAYAQPTADLSFKCDIDTRGYIRDIDISRR